ncbi:MAG: glycosyltransferase [Polyangiaceae bacterium]|jgi:ceramide glucosyltransferase
MVYIAVALTLTSLALYAAMMTLFVRAMMKRRRGICSGGPGPSRRVGAPPVTIFKPLAGSDDDLEGNLESFARIEYPSFEVLLGVANRADPAFGVARRFVARHPRLDARIVLTDPNAAVNPKVAQLVGLEAVARGEVWVISDSNVRVQSSYLRTMVDELADERVGIVTSLFSGNGEESLGAAIENLQICAATAPGIAAVAVVSRRSFTVGKSIAVRRADLIRIGGFSSVGGVLAEDHVLGRRFAEAGFEMRLSHEIVANWNVRCSVRRTLERHTRWAQLRRSILPWWCFGAEPSLNPIALATVCWILAPGAVMGVCWAAVALAQMGGAVAAVRLLRGRAVAWWHGPLEIVRSVLALICWIRACASRKISWRGHPFWLLRGSEILPVPSRTAGSPTRESLPA